MDAPDPPPLPPARETPPPALGYAGYPAYRPPRGMSAGKIVLLVVSIVLGVALLALGTCWFVISRG